MLHNFSPVLAVDRGLTIMSGHFTTDGAGAITANSLIGQGYTVSKPSGTGIYRITPDHAYADGVAVLGNTLFASPTEYFVQAQVEDVASATPTVDFQVYQGGANQSAAVRLPADDASGATTELGVWRAPFACTVTGVYVVPDAALTADNTNFSTLTVSHYTSAGGSKTALASLTTEITGSGDWVAFAPEALTISSAALTAGQAVSFESATSGTGVNLPLMGLVIEYTTFAAADLLSGRLDFMLALYRSGANIA